MNWALGTILSDDLGRRLFSGGLSALVVKVAAAGVTYLMFVALARLMPAAEYGRFAFGLSLAITLSLVFSFGLPTAVLRFWPQYRAEYNDALGRSFVARGFAAMWIGAGTLALVFFFGGLLVARGGEGMTVRYLSAVALLMLTMAMSEYVASTLRADGAIVTALAPRDVIWRVLLIGASVAAARMFPGFGAEAALQLAVVLLAALVLGQVVLAVRRLNLGRADLHGPVDRTQWITALWPMWASAVLFGFVQQFDVVLLGLFLKPEATGPYFAALRTAGLMSLVLFAGNMVAAPMVSRLFHSGDQAGLQRLFRVLILLIVAPTAIGLLVLAVLGRWLLGLFDPAFTDAYGLLMVIGTGLALAAAGGPTATSLQMVGREQDYLKTMAVTYAGVVASQCLLIPLLGPMGAAIPNAVGATAQALWAVILFRRHVGADPSVLGLVLPPAAPADDSAPTGQPQG